MKQYLRTYFNTNDITYDEQFQDKHPTVIIRPRHKEQTIALLEQKKAKYEVEERLNLVFLHMK